MQFTQSLYTASLSCYNIWTMVQKSALVMLLLWARIVVPAHQFIPILSPDGTPHVSSDSVPATPERTPNSTLKRPHEEEDVSPEKYTRIRRTLFSATRSHTMGPDKNNPECQHIRMPMNSEELLSRLRDLHARLDTSSAVNESEDSTRGYGVSFKNRPAKKSGSKIKKQYTQEDPSGEDPFQMLFKRWYAQLKYPSMARTGFIDIVNTVFLNVVKAGWLGPQDLKLLHDAGAQDCEYDPEDRILRTNYFGPFGGFTTTSFDPDRQEAVTFGFDRPPHLDNPTPGFLAIVAGNTPFPVVAQTPPTDRTRGQISQTDRVIVPDTPRQFKYLDNTTDTGDTADTTDTGDTTDKGDTTYTGDTSDTGDGILYPMLLVQTGDNFWDFSRTPPIS